MSATHRVRQFFTALTARIAPEERLLVERQLTREQLALFDAMPANDQRHALNVVRHLLAAGWDDAHLLQAALLHDAGKAAGGVGVLTRVAVVLLRQIDGGLVERLSTMPLIPCRRALYVQLHHARIGAELAMVAGSVPEVVRLIRCHEEPPLDVLASALRKADEEN